MLKIERKIINLLIDTIEGMIGPEFVLNAEGDYVRDLTAAERRKRITKLRKMMEKIP